MAIGTSMGAFFQDEFHMHANPYLEAPMSTPDNMEVSPNNILPDEDKDITLLPVEFET